MGTFFETQCRYINTQSILSQVWLGLIKEPLSLRLMEQAFSGPNVIPAAQSRA